MRFVRRCSLASVAVWWRACAPHGHANMNFCCTAPFPCWYWTLSIWLYWNSVKWRTFSAKTFAKNGRRNMICWILRMVGIDWTLFCMHINLWATISILILSSTGRYITTFTAIVSIIIAFVESQITFCLLNKSQLVRKKSKINRKNRRAQYVDTDQTADLEYVIPKVCT